MELGAQCFEHFFPVMMSGQTTTGRKANHVAGIELSRNHQSWMRTSSEKDLHIKRRKSVAARRKRDANAVVERVRLIIWRRIFALV
jgi:hypothetical protein